MSFTDTMQILTEASLLDLLRSPLDAQTKVRKLVIGAFEAGFGSFENKFMIVMRRSTNNSALSVIQTCETY